MQCCPILLHLHCPIQFRKVTDIPELYKLGLQCLQTRNCLTLAVSDICNQSIFSEVSDTEGFCVYGGHSENSLNCLIGIYKGKYCFALNKDTKRISRWKKKENMTFQN